MADQIPPPARVSYALPVHRPGDEVIVAWQHATGAFTARITETYAVDGHPFVADVPIPGRGSGPMTFTTADDLLATVDPFVHISHGFATQLRLDQAQPQSSVRPPGGWGGQTTAHRDPDPATLPCIVIDPPPFPTGPPPPAPRLPAAADRALTPALLRAYASGAGADLFDLGRRAWLLGFTSSGTDHDAGDLAAFARAAVDRPDLLGRPIPTTAAPPATSWPTVQRLLGLAVAVAARAAQPDGRAIAQTLSDLTERGRAPAHTARFLGAPADALITATIRAIQPHRLTVAYRAFSRDGSGGGVADLIAAAMYARGQQTADHVGGLHEQLRHHVGALLHSATATSPAATTYPRSPDRRPAALASLATVDAARPPPTVSRSARHGR